MFFDTRSKKIKKKKTVKKIKKVSDSDLKVYDTKINTKIRKKFYVTYGPRSVDIIAIAIPSIPYILPCRADS